MAGAINKTRLYTRIRPDWRAVKLLNRLRNKKDDSILRAIARELEAEGIHIEAFHHSPTLAPRPRRDLDASQAKPARG